MLCILSVHSWKFASFPVAFIQELRAELQKLEDSEAYGTDGSQGKGEQVEPVPCSGTV